MLICVLYKTWHVLICVVYKTWNVLICVVYKTWHVLMCSVQNFFFYEVFKSPGDPEAHTYTEIKKFKNFKQNVLFKNKDLHVEARLYSYNNQ